MRGFKWTSGVFALAVALCMPGMLRAEGKPDLSSPKKAATAFALALQRGDFEALKEVTTGGEDDYKLMKSITGMTAAANKFHDAAVARFGPEEGKKIAVGTGDPGDIPRQIEASNEKVEGDSASITKKGETEANSVRLKKAGNDWKVDLTLFPQKDQIAKQAPMLDAMGSVLASGSSDVASGKYKTATEASLDVQQRMMSVMATMVKPAQVPAGAAAAPPATQGR